MILHYVPIPVKNKSYIHNNLIGPGTFYGKMLLESIIENNKINAYFRSGKVK